jgi:PhnB protein
MARVRGTHGVERSRNLNVPSMPVKPEDKDRVMHATLRIGGGTVMISDGPPGKTVPTESNAWVTLNYEDAGEMAQQFDALGPVDRS